MENTEVIRKYELVVIVDSKFTDEDKESICKEVVDVISKNNGKVINSQTWLEKQRFTFPIKKRTEGTYYLFNVEGEGSIIEKARRMLRLNERILRFVFIKVESQLVAQAA